jgi:hypothetical protein
LEACVTGLATINGPGTPVPYPAETQAKGWRFEIDYEQIDQSDTWDLAAEVPMAQPALLMMWLVAWRQKPCGSLPADEAIIRSKCRIPPSAWAKCRDVCMRGWWIAEDGRLYHDIIVSRVLAMLVKREKDAGRTAARRARSAGAEATQPGVAGVSRVTPAGLTREFDTKHQAPSTSKTPKAPTGAEVRFESFWTAYPKKVGKDAAERAFAKRKPDEATLAAMLSAVASQAASPAWERDAGQFIPNPATWLNEGRWKDGNVEASATLMAGAI